MEETQKRVLTIVLLVALVLVVVIGFGRVEYHNELEQSAQEHALIGYVDDSLHEGNIKLRAQDYPQWCRDVGTVQPQVVRFPEGEDGYIGLYANVVYFENRMEKRAWFSGKLLERNSEYYYKVYGPVSAEPVMEWEEPVSDGNRLVAEDYDYMGFK